MKQFIMGAKLTMQDQASKGIAAAGKATKTLTSNMNTANATLAKHAKQTDRARDAMGHFVKTGDGAASKVKGWIGGNGKLASSFSALKSGIGAAAGAFGLWKAKEWLIDSNADMETYRNTLNIVMKDAKKAGTTLNWAVGFAANTPFEIPQVVEATTKLTTYGFVAQKTLGIVGDMASVMGKDLMQAVEAVADAQTGEIERLKEFGITKKMLEDKAKTMNLKIVDNQGSITDMKAFNATLFAIMEDRFKGGMDAQSKTFKGMVSNAKDFIASIGRTLGQPIFDRLKVQFEKIMKWANGVQASGVFDKWAKSIGTALDKIEAYFSKFSSDKNFKSMSLAEKFIYVLKDMLTKANEYMHGPGGDQVKDVFKVITKTLIEVLSGAFTELTPIAVDLGVTIGSAIVTGMGQAIGNKIQEPLSDMENSFKAAAADVKKDPTILVDPQYSSFGLVKKLWDKARGDSPAAKADSAKPGRNAAGTKAWRGGWTTINERGPELVNLPKGTQIASNYESRQMVNPVGTGGASGGKGGIHIGKLVEKIVIEGGGNDPKAIAGEVMEALHELMRQAKEISGSADMGALLA